jgi:hypothetical protein
MSGNPLLSPFHAVKPFSVVVDGWHVFNATAASQLRRALTANVESCMRTNRQKVEYPWRGNCSKYCICHLPSDVCSSSASVLQLFTILRWDWTLLECFARVPGLYLDAGRHITSHSQRKLCRQRRRLVQSAVAGHTKLTGCRMSDRTPTQWIRGEFIWVLLYRKWTNVGN